MSNVIDNTVKHRIERVRHETKRRWVAVKGVRNVTSKMIRITFTGSSLDGFASLGYDDHVKIFVRNDMSDATGSAQGEMVGRDYTPRRYDPASCELEIDFAIHEAGPATNWARGAKVGDMVEIGGPRGSFVVSDDFDWYLFVGDDTALPAIGRRLSELRTGVRAIVITEVSDRSEEQIFDSKALIETHWVHRIPGPENSSMLVDVVNQFQLPSGDGYVWIACESQIAKLLRRIVTDKKGHPKAWVKAAGYWQRGVPSFHQTHDD